MLEQQKTWAVLDTRPSTLPSLLFTARTTTSRACNTQLVPVPHKIETSPLSRRAHSTSDEIIQTVPPARHVPHKTLVPFIQRQAAVSAKHLPNLEQARLRAAASCASEHTYSGRYDNLKRIDLAIEIFRVTNSDRQANLSSLADYHLFCTRRRSTPICSKLHKHIGPRYTTMAFVSWILVIASVVGLWIKVFRRPVLPKNAPNWWSGHDWPFLGATRFYTNRKDHFLDGLRSSSTGAFSFYIGRKHLIGLSGPAGRKVFYETRGLSLAAG